MKHVKPKVKRIQTWYAHQEPDGSFDCHAKFASFLEMRLPFLFSNKKTAEKLACGNKVVKVKLVEVK